MEDAHLAVSPLSDGNNSFFGIFDGHGGKIFFLL
jgi:serine/threonine protein phosphatase PrpC